MVNLKIDNTQTNKVEYTLKISGKKIKTAYETTVIKCLNSARRVANTYLENNGSSQQIKRWKPVNMTSAEDVLHFQGELIC